MESKTIHDLSTLNIADNDDELIIYDVSASDSKKITKKSLCNNSYSTTEEKTGGTWIDGKPIYRKVFTGLEFGETTNAYTTTGASLPDADKLINAYSIANDGAIITHFIGYVLSYGVIYYWTETPWVNQNYLIVEYTKTTG